MARKLKIMIGVGVLLILVGFTGNFLGGDKVGNSANPYPQICANGNQNNLSYGMMGSDGTRSGRNSMMDHRY